MKELKAQLLLKRHHLICDELVEMRACAYVRSLFTNELVCM